MNCVRAELMGHGMKISCGVVSCGVLVILSTPFSCSSVA